MANIVGTYKVSKTHGGSMYGPEETRYILIGSKEGVATLSYYHMVPDCGVTNMKYTGSLKLTDGIVTFQATHESDEQKPSDGQETTGSAHLEQFLVMSDGSLAVLSGTDGSTVKQLDGQDIVLGKITEPTSGSATFSTRKLVESHDDKDFEVFTSLELEYSGKGSGSFKLVYSHVVCYPGGDSWPDEYSQAVSTKSGSFVQDGLNFKFSAATNTYSQNEDRKDVHKEEEEVTWYVVGKEMISSSVFGHWHRYVPSLNRFQYGGYSCKPEGLKLTTGSFSQSE